MDNDEIRALLRELKMRSDESGEVKSESIKINFQEEKAPVRKKNRGQPRPRRKKLQEDSSKSPKSSLKESESFPEEEDKEKKPEPFPEEDKEKKPKSFPEEEDKEKKPESFPEEDKEKKPELSAEKKSRKNELTSSPEVRDEDGKTKPVRRKSDKTEKGSTPWKNLKLAVRSYLDDWKAKGIGDKELIMIGFGVVLVILLLFVVYSAVFGQKMSENVTADEGLSVMVEQEPKAWCRKAVVTLGIRSNKTMQSITVNGKSVEFEGGRRTTIQVEASTETLELMVVTEADVRTAQVEIPMIDEEEPSVTLEQENGQVTITALDERSGLEGIYYGTTTGFSDVPRYQKYTGPFLCETGKIYYYYAQDYAGNRTSTVATDMQPAQALTLNETEVTLFPGDSFSLQAAASPQKAYCNHLQIVNQNPDIVSLSDDGLVTALKEGDAVIEATAEGLAAVSCLVQVRAEAELTLSVIGDCTLGDDVNFSAANSFSTVYSMYGASWFFQNVKSVLGEDDLTFANFEGTLTTSETRENKEYAFKGAPEYTQILKDGSVEAVTLANNHSSDYGAQSLTDTKQYLTEAGIDYCTGEEIIYREIKGVTVALIGIYVLDTGIEKASQVEQTIADAKQNGADLIVVGFHWGSEKSNYPDETQQSLAHTAIDCGADLVVGHHPHVLQGIEQYQGKYIVYSLGNFCFGGNSTPSDMDTMIFRQTFSVTAEGNVEDAGIHIIPCSVSSAAGWNNYQPTPLEGTEAERIMGRINEYSAQFGLSFE